MNEQQFLFGSEVGVLDKTEYEYLPIISPIQEVKDYVKEKQVIIKPSLRNLGVIFPAIAHITLFHGIFKKEMDTTFKTAVLNASKKLRCFTVKLKGFDYFQHGKKSNTIFISIDNKDEVTKAFHSLINELPFNQTDFVPHITIAKRIPRNKFPIVMNYFEKINYEKDFLCDKITLLRRTILNGKKGCYETLTEAPLLQR